MTPTTLTREPSRGAVGALVLVAASVVILVAPVWPSLNRIWLRHYSAYNHGYLVLAVGVWLTAQELRRRPLGDFSPSALGLAALTAVTAAMVIARVGDILQAAQLLVFIIPLTSLWALGGGPLTRRFVLGAAYCLFGLPLWSFPNTVLRDITIANVTFLVRLSSIPAYIDTSFIHLPYGTIHIADTCSGLRYFLVASALATYYGAVSYTRWGPRLMVIGSAAFLAMVANWVRIYILVVVGYLSKMQNYLIRVDHSVFGWVLFFVFFVPLFLFVRRVERRLGYVEAQATDVKPAAGTGDAGPLAWEPRHYVTVGLVSVILLGGATVNFLAIPSPNQRARASQGALPSEIGDWTRYGRWNDATTPRYAGADWQDAEYYRLGAREVGLYVASYTVQSQNKEVVHVGNSPMGAQEPLLRHSTIEHGAVAELEVASGSGPRLIWYSYDVAGRRTASAFWAKVYQVLGALGRRWDARVLVISASCGLDCNKARKSLRGFMDKARAAT